MLQYERSFALRGSDFDCYNHLRPSSVLDLFQEVAGRHAEEMGLGFFDLIREKKIWVITKVKYRMVGELHRNETVTVRTWPLPPNRVNFRREYMITGEDGRQVVVGTSEWVMVHSEKRRVIPAENLYPAGEFCTETLFPGRVGKVPRFTSEEVGTVICPAFSHLDLNGHVNNIRYADFVMDALHPDGTRQVREFQMDYHREVLLGTPVRIQTERRENDILAQGISESGEIMFSCRMETECVATEK